MSVPQPLGGVPFDARALSDPVDAAEVRAHARALRAQSSQNVTRNIVGAITTIFVIFLAFMIVVPLFVGGIALFVSNAASGAADLGSTLIAAFATLLPAMLLAVVGGAVLLSFRRSSRRRDERRYRLSRFAAANGMHFITHEQNPPLPGMIFGIGTDRTGEDLLRGTEPRFVEFGNYRYTISSGKSSTTHHWGFVAIHLDVPLPHIVLDARSNNSVFGSNLPASFSRDQRLELEGDFNRHFALYCPQGYERDALYLFTPDIMARFIDHAAALDVEIIDNWLFLYAKREFSTTDPNTWAWLFSTVGALMTKFEQWARWRDDRLQLEQHRTGAASGLPFAAPTELLTPPPGVAREGQRLKRSYSWMIIFAVVFGCFWFIVRLLGS